MSIIFSRELLNNTLKCVRLITDKNLNKFYTVKRNVARVKNDSRNQDKFRLFTKKEIDKLPFSDSYFEQLDGNYLESPMDSTTSSVSECSVLVRNNTGSDLFILNNEYLGNNSISYLTKELKNLELNIYKRFGIISSVNRTVFSKGLNEIEFAKFNESYDKFSNNPLSGEFGNKKDLIGYLRNVCNLLYTIKTFKKPLIVYGNGQMDNRYFNSFGSSYVLSTLKGNLGEYLLLTNDKLVGKDLIWGGLVKRFIEPNNINNLQILSDRLVELPEKYVESYLNEFNIRINFETDKGDDLNDSCKVKEFQSVINHHFKHDKVNDVLNSLQTSFTNSSQYKNSTEDDSNKVEESIRQFEALTLEKVKQNINNKTVTKMFNVVKELKRNRFEVLGELNVNQTEWNNMISLSYKSTQNAQQENAKILYNQIMDFMLIKSLNLEVETFYKQLIS